MISIPKEHWFQAWKTHHCKNEGQRDFGKGFVYVRKPYPIVLPVVEPHVVDGLLDDRMLVDAFIATFLTFLA